MSDYTGEAFSGVAGLALGLLTWWGNRKMARSREEVGLAQVEVERQRVQSDEVEHIIKGFAELVQSLQSTIVDVRGDVLATREELAETRHAFAAERAKWDAKEAGYMARIEDLTNRLEQREALLKQRDAELAELQLTLTQRVQSAVAGLQQAGVLPLQPKGT